MNINSIILVVSVLQTLSCNENRAILDIKRMDIGSDNFECINGFEGFAFSEQDSSVTFYKLNEMAMDEILGIYNVIKYRFTDDIIVLVENTSRTLNIDSLGLSSLDISSFCAPSDFVEDADFTDETRKNIQGKNHIYSRKIDINQDGIQELVQIRTSGEIRDGQYGGKFHFDENISGELYVFIKTEIGWSLAGFVEIPWGKLYSLEICEIDKVVLGNRSGTVINIITRDRSMLSVSQDSYCSNFFYLKLD